MSDLSLRDLADVAEAAIIDGVNGIVDRADVQNKLDMAISRSWPDRETWGMSDEQQRAQQALMDQAGQRPKAEAG